MLQEFADEAENVLRACNPRLLQLLNAMVLVGH